VAIDPGGDMNERRVAVLGGEVFVLHFVEAYGWVWISLDNEGKVIVPEGGKFYHHPVTAIKDMDARGGEHKPHADLGQVFALRESEKQIASFAARGFRIEDSERIARLFSRIRSSSHSAR